MDSKADAPDLEPENELDRDYFRQPLSAAFRESGHEPAKKPGAKPKVREQSDFQKLLAYALKALARREHSQVELRRKLNAYLDREYSGGASDASSAVSYAGSPEGTSERSGDAVSRVIEALVLDGSLSDERFAAEFVRSRVLKGYGPIRIRMDLLERGVPDRLAEDELTRPSEFWQQQAAEVCVRKFGDPQSFDAPGFSEYEHKHTPKHTPKHREQKEPDLEYDLEDASPEDIRQLMKDRKDAAQRRWNRCARFLSQRGFPADLIYRTLDGRLLD